LPKRKDKQKKMAVALEQPIPPCPCGAPRVFEMQLLPSLLHVLKVDEYGSEDVDDGMDARSLAVWQQGGMNWGNIAIYSCSQGCGSEQGGFAVVQKSVDELPGPQAIIPVRTAADTEPVIIAEGTKFDDDDDDDDDVVAGDEDMDEDEDDDDDNNNDCIDNEEEDES